jgi:hypothetical protein
MLSKRLQKRETYLRAALAKKGKTEAEIKEIVDRMLSSTVHRDLTRQAEHQVELELNPRPTAHIKTDQYKAGRAAAVAKDVKFKADQVALRMQYRLCGEVNARERLEKAASAQEKLAQEALARFLADRDEKIAANLAARKAARRKFDETEPFAQVMVPVVDVELAREEGLLVEPALDWEAVLNSVKPLEKDDA